MKDLSQMLDCCTTEEQARGVLARTKDIKSCLTDVLAIASDRHWADLFGDILKRSLPLGSELGQVRSEAVLDAHFNPDMLVFVRLFLEAGWDIDFPLRDNRTATMSGATTDTGLLDVCLDYEPDLSLADDAGWTALMYATSFDPAVGDPRDALRRVKLLLQHGASRGQRDLAGKTALDICHEQGTDTQLRDEIAGVLADKAKR